MKLLRLILLVLSIFACASSLASAQAGGACKIGINLDVNSYYNNQGMWADVFHQFKRWGGTGTLYWQEPTPPVATDANGWPLADCGSYITNPKGEYPAGQYILSYTGKADIIFLNGAQVQAGSVKTNGGVTTAIVNFGGFGVDIAMNVLRVDPSNPPKNIRLLYPGEDGTRLLNARARQRLSVFSCIRCMDLLGANWSALSNWTDRPQPGAFPGVSLYGTSYEDCIQIAKEAGTDCWLNIPVDATDDFVTNLAKLVLATGDPAHHYYIEYANEVWNGGQYCGRQNQANANNNPALTSLTQMGKNGQQYATKVVAFSKIFQSVFGNQSSRFGFVYNAVSADPNNYFYPFSADGLDYIAAKLGPPSQFIETFSMPTYFGIGYKDASSTVDSCFAAVLNTQAAEWQKYWTGYAAFARKYGLKLTSYESGTTTGNTPTEIACLNDPRIATLEGQMIDAWAAAGGGLWNQFDWIKAWGPSGSWGAAQWASDISGPKYQGVLAAAQKYNGAATPPAASPPATRLKIACGCLADPPAGWSVDSGFVGGSVDSQGSDPGVIHNERWGMSGYKLSLAPGSYMLTLTFAELHNAITGPGQRVFDVSVQGQQALTSFDPFAIAGGRNVAVTRSMPVTVAADGVLAIGFVPHVQNPTLSAIEVEPVVPPAPPPVAAQPSDTIPAPAVTPPKTSPTTRPAGLINMGKIGSHTWYVDPAN